MKDVFISYAREDSEFVSHLHAALREQGLDVWVDTKGLYAGETFLPEILAAIEGADAFVFVISPASAASAHCRQEIDHAASLSKRILPVVRAEPAQDVPAPAASRQWLFFREDDDFARGVEALVDAVRTDPAYVRAHTRLLVRATEWERSEQNSSFLLRGSDLKAAEAWLAGAEAHEEPRPTPLHVAYVTASRKGAVKRRRITAAAVAAGLIVAAGLALVAQVQSREKDRQQAIADARQLANQAELVRGEPGGLVQSLGLAVDAMSRLREVGVRSVDADLAVRRGLALLPRPAGRFDLDLRQADVVAFSPDGRRLTAASRYLEARTWDLDDGQGVAQMNKDGAARAAALSPDGLYLATADDAGQGGFVTVWDVAAGTPQARCAYDGSIGALALSPGGRYLAVDSWEAETLVLETEGCKALARLERSERPAFSPDGAYLASGDLAGRVWKIGTGQGTARVQAVEALTRSRTRAVAFSPDGRHLARADISGTVTVWDVATAQPQATLQHEEAPRLMALSTGGTYLAVAAAGDSYTATVREVAGARLAARLYRRSELKAMAFSPGRPLLATGRLDGGVDVWEIGSAGDNVARLDPPGEVLDATLAPGDANLAMLTGPGPAATLRVTDLSAPRDTPAVALPVRATAFAFSADGRFLAAAGADTARVVAVADGRTVVAFAQTGITALALGADGRFLAAADAEGRARIVDLDGPREVTRFTFEGVWKAAALAPEATRLVALCGSGFVGRGGEALSLRVWDLPGGALADSLDLGFDRRVSGYALSPHGRYLAVAEGERVTIRALARAGEDADATTLTHEGRVHTLAFSPDAQHLATAGTDGTVRIWTVPGGQEVARLEQMDGVRRVGFSPSGRYLVTVHGDDRVAVWLLHPDDLIAAARARLPEDTPPLE